MSVVTPATEMRTAQRLRTPMTAILGMADALWETQLSDDQRRCLSVLRGAGRTLLAALDELLCADADGEASEHGPAPEPHREVRTPRSPRILMAEDSADNQLLIQCYLKNTPYELEVVDNGAQAVERVTTSEYELVLMDIQMPEMDGWSATRAIREWERGHGCPAVPIIAVSAFARREDFQRSLDAGCNAHITKPLRRATLLETIQAHLVPGARPS